jgi:hypothetical protein
MKHQRSCWKCKKLQHDVLKKAELDAEGSCFDEFPERHFELANWQTPRWFATHRVFVICGWFSISWRISSSATKMRSSHWRPRSRLFISKRPKSRRCCTTFTKVRALRKPLWFTLKFLSWLNFELNNNKKLYYDFFSPIFFIKFSGSQFIFFLTFSPFFLEKYQHLLLSRHLLRSSTTG